MLFYFSIVGYRDNFDGMESVDYKRCEKSSSHQEFVSVEGLTLDILPHGYRDDDLLSYMKAVSDLTVQLTVTKTSGRTSEHSCDLVNSGITYKEVARAGAGYVDLDAKMYLKRCGCRDSSVRTGTGYINLVTTEHNKPCQCGECASNTSPRMKWGLIYVTTTAHIVYDETDAAETTCHLWFDRGRRPDLCIEAVALSGMKLAYRDLIRDYTVMTYATHDLNLVNRLETICACADILSHIISHKYPKRQRKRAPAGVYCVSPA